MKVSMFTILFLSIFLLGAKGCATGEPLESLCILDSKRQVCWENMEEEIGKSYDEIDTYFAMNEKDMKRIFKRLNKCRTQMK